MKQKLKKEFEKPMLTREELLEILKHIFRKHIGRKKPITKGQLFEAIYGYPEQYDPYELWYLWLKIKQGMNWLRRTTKYFVVSQPNETYPSIWEYFIVVDYMDSEHYKQLLKGTKKKIDYMLIKVDEAVRKEFWRDVRSGKGD